MLKAFWATIQCGRHHGKGLKYRRRGDLENAVTHFKQALPNAERTGNDATVAFEMECIAITYLEMNKLLDAKKYAESSLAYYRTLSALSKDDLFTKAVSRLEKMLSKIQT